MSDNVRYFEERPRPHFYRTYRTLPYTVPLQKDGFAIFPAQGQVADAILTQQYFLPRVQRPHDPVWGEVSTAVHPLQTLG